MGKIKTGHLWLYHSITTISGTAGSDLTTGTLAEFDMLEFQGTITGNSNITLPSDDGRQWTIYNNTTGGYNLVAKTASGTGVTVPPGQRIQVRADGTNIAARISQNRHALYGSQEAAPTGSQVVFRRVLERPVTFRKGLPDSAFGAGTAATASATFTIKQNSTSIGTLVWAASGTVPTVTFSADVNASAGDMITIVAPSSPDATLAGLAFSLIGWYFGS